jgi:hypothetical protein
VLPDAAQELIAFGRRGCPNRLEVCRRASPELHVRIHLAARRDMEMEKGLVAIVEVRVVIVTTRHVDKSIDCAERFDELGMSRTAVVGICDPVRR